MRLSDAYPSRFLTAEDLSGKDALVTITSAEMEIIGQGKEAKNKLVIGFQGKKKQMVLNKTNAVTIGRLYGDDTDGWIGKSITLVTRDIEYEGELIAALRINPKIPSVAAATHGTMGKPKTAPEPSDNDGGTNDAEPGF